MSEWLSYRLSDFLLFSEATYFRLYELHNAALWPLPWVSAAFGALFIVLLYRNTPHRHFIISAMLVALWLWVGWAFHLQRYATINWIAPVFGVAFFIQAALLGGLGLIGNRLRYQQPKTLRHALGPALVIYAVIIHPLLGPLAQGEWGRAEVFGIAPDPSAIATLGMLMLTRARHRWVLFIVPLLWCLISAATLWAMSNLQFWVPLLAVVLVIGAGILHLARGIVRAP